MDDPFANMDPEKRRRGSLAVLRALYSELYGGEPTPDEPPSAAGETASEASEGNPEADEGGAAAPDQNDGPSPEPDSVESACLAGHHRCRRMR